MTTQHCTDHEGHYGKVEGANNTLVPLAGTPVCVKAGPYATDVIVADGTTTLQGYVAAAGITVGNGNVPDVSYYVDYSPPTTVGPDPEPEQPPVDPEPEQPDPEPEPAPDPNPEPEPEPTPEPQPEPAPAPKTSTEPEAPVQLEEPGQPTAEVAQPDTALATLPVTGADPALTLALIGAALIAAGTATLRRISPRR